MTISAEQAKRLGTAVRGTASARVRRRRIGGAAVFLTAVSSAAVLSGLSLHAGAVPAAKETRMKLGAMVAVSSLALSQVAAGQAVQWKVSDGGNGHWYSVLREPEGFSLATARIRASSVGASLFTGCGSEFDFAIANSGALVLDGWIPLGPHLLGPWIGLARDGNGFVWPDGTTCAFDRWDTAAHQPDGMGEDAVMLYSTNDNVASRCHDVGSDRLSRSAVIEWSADCNNDGLVDYGQCRDGSLPDYNGNNIPDCCEQGTACVVGNYAVEWRVEDGGNGHWYQCSRTTGTGEVWTQAQASAVATGGHLATLTSVVENDWVYALTIARGVWDGRTGPLLGGIKTADNTFRWVTGEPWTYSNWLPGEPSSGLWEPYLNFLGPQYTTQSSPTWNDTDGLLPPNREYLNVVLEWSADCNNDGIVDYGQILTGQLADTDSNGVPDTCESTILVPSQFPSIQAAIDSVPTNAQRTIQVAAGTYHESFSLNGKNVIVRGAPNNATILDGTGLPSSIATFASGEPATAGLEHLVFRNATVGSTIFKGALFKVGGAVYGLSSSGFIRGCRFEGNRSDYGGGAYLLYCNMTVENCVFSANTGISEGGGLMAFGTTGAVRNCEFTGNQCGTSGVGGGSAFKAAGALNTGEVVVFDGCTVTGNTAGVEGGAVEYYENVELHPGTLRIMNSTITGNRSGLGALYGAGGLTVTGRMQSCVVDAGTVLCGNLPRNVKGAYYIAGSPTICDCLADLSGDGVVNGADLGLLLNAWGPTAPNGAGDVNHDGVVNGPDLALMLGSWGVCQ